MVYNEKRGQTHSRKVSFCGMYGPRDDSFKLLRINLVLSD